MNSEIVKILQNAVDDDENPGNLERYVDKESERFKQALRDALKSLYGDK